MLRVEAGPVEYLGYDDGGTPEDESDDNHLCYLRWYALYSGRDSSYGEIWLYDPDLDRVKIWLVPVLECVVHEGCDGLTANLNGETHGVIVHVPVKLMSKEGTYRFVLHFYDDYADSYKDHQVKAALEVNQRTPEPALHVWVGQNIAQKLKNYKNITQIVDDAFKRIFVTVTWHWGPNNLGCPLKRGPDGRLRLPSDVAKEANRSFRGIHVLLEDWPLGTVDESLSSLHRWYGETWHPLPGSMYKYSPQNPAMTYVRFDELFEVAQRNFEWALANVLIHEFTHAASRNSVKDCLQVSCVMYFELSRYHLCEIDHGSAIYTTRSLIPFLGRTWTYNVPLGPWHSVNEVFAIRKGIGLGELHEKWSQ